ncbi:paired box protein Pax-2a-like [Montipora capricornis]|uniref:paired box protein Pax-2a-like n=1 Tax=Montipora capricornis TaxID=246305 RepID=UPI0035F109F6
MYRDRTLGLHHEGLSERQVAREARVSHIYVGKVIKRYDESNTDLRAQRSHFVKPKGDQTVSEYIECCRLMNPSIYGSEIRQRLLLDGVVHPAEIPSVSQINRVSHTQHAITRKRITVDPRESTTPSATEAVDAFLNEISNFKAPKLHFFDESSVVKTTGNRKYGSVGHQEHLRFRFVSDWKVKSL